MSKGFNNEKIIEFIEKECSEWLDLNVLSIIDKNEILIMDNESYKYLTSYAVVRNAKKRNIQLSKFFRNNPYTVENIKNYLSINNINHTLVTDKISNATEKVIWNCKNHGNFEMSWNCAKNGQGCPECGKLKNAEKKRNSYNYIKDEFKKRNMILVSDIYINNEALLDFICFKHQDKGIQQVSYGNIIGKETGCTYCNKENYLKKITKTHDKFVEEIYSVHGEKYTILGEYKGASKHIKTKCNECGNIWDIKVSHLLSGHGCPVCKSPSKGEDLIREYLQNNNIKFKEQYRIKECRYKKPLPFDFAILNTDNKLSCLIEFDGRQHFRPTGFGCTSESKINKNFQLQKTRDKIKDDYCKLNNIKLIRIPYWEINKINNILDTELSVFFN